MHLQQGTHEATVIKLKGKIENPVITFRDFSNPFSNIYRIISQKICKEQGILNSISKLDLISIY
jgi:hypothetical protein